MQFRDLNAQYMKIKSKIDDAVFETISEGHYIGGRQVKELEDTLAKYVGTKHCISCANGTDALQLALMAWGIGAGDAVFVPDFTFFSSAETIAVVGATPIFVDVEDDTINMCPASLERAVEAVLEEGVLNAKAICAVDIFGQPAGHEAIREIAEKYKLYVLEDGAQSFGGNINGRMVCSFGDISTTSFFPAKPLGCYGDGGAIFTDNDEWAEILNSLKVHGKGLNKYDNVRIGMNSRLDTIQAAVLLAKFDNFVRYEIADINKVARRYTELLKGYVKTPVVRDGYTSSWAQYTIQLKDIEERTRVIDALKKENIPAMVYYPKPLHKQDAFVGAKKYTELEVTEKLCDTVLSLPLHPYMNDTDIESVANTIIAAIEQN